MQTGGGVLYRCRNRQMLNKIVFKWCYEWKWIYDAIQRNWSNPTMFWNVSSSLGLGSSKPNLLVWMWCVLAFVLRGVPGNPVCLSDGFLWGLRGRMPQAACRIVGRTVTAYFLRPCSGVNGYQVHGPSYSAFLFCSFTRSKVRLQTECNH